MKKFSLLSNEQIRKHLANTSPAKVTHSFSKSKRFTKKDPQCKEAFYGSTTSLSNRSSGIGFGKRSDFTHNTIVSPASPTYKTRSQFDKLGQTFGFSLGREKCPNRHYTYHVSKEKVPGPGAYQNARTSLSNISYTHRPRTIDLAKKKLTFLEVPGPGKYESVEMTPSNGKFRISKYSNSRLSMINRDSRFKQVKQLSPGPGIYNTIDNLSKDSKYLLSNRKGFGTRPFDHEKKFTYQYWKYDENPEPGRYDRPSDFGVYGDYNYYKSLTLRD